MTKPVHLSKWGQSFRMYFSREMRSIRTGTMLCLEMQTKSGRHYDMPAAKNSANGRQMSKAARSEGGYV